MCIPQQEISTAISGHQGIKMMGSFLSRALLMIFGYAYPAYQCFKVVEKSKPEIEQLLFWCQYWILVAVLTVCERLGDNLISWLPMYSEAKLAFVIYLWHQKTTGTIYVYNCFFRPFLTKHEAEIDGSLFELRVKGGKLALVYWEKAATHAQMKFFEIMQYATSQSTSQPHSSQREQSSELKKKTEEPLLSHENGHSESSQQETDSKESVHLRRGRWRMQNAI